MIQMQRVTDCGVLIYFTPSPLKLRELHGTWGAKVFKAKDQRRILGNGIIWIHRHLHF